MADHVPIEDTHMFKVFESVADDVWDLVDTWKPFPKLAMGKQFVQAADSITANLAEGDGRFGGPDAIRFFITARASARETLDWIKKAGKRKLASEEMIMSLQGRVNAGLKELNAIINYRRRVGQSSLVKETVAGYDC